MLRWYNYMMLHYIVDSVYVTAEMQASTHNKTEYMILENNWATTCCNYMLTSSSKLI